MYINFILIVYDFKQSGKASSTIERLTDVSKYTGAHKHRFDESGKGRGIAGRKD